jgi:DNA-binding NarL/FixJ family response regulator
VWIADGQRLLAHALATYFASEHDLEVAGISTSLDVVAIRRAHTDVLIVSFFLLSTDQAAVIAQIRAELPDLKIVVLVASEDDLTLAACVRVGAGGCISRNALPDDLVAAIRSIVEGNVLFSPDVLLRLLRRYGSEGFMPAESETVRLAPRELDVLQGYAEGLSSSQVGARLVISPHTVRSHAKSALAKLGAHTRAEGIAIAIKHGLIHSPER